MQWCQWQHHWHHKDISRCFYTCIDMSSHFVDISRYCLHTKRHHMDTIMISLVNSLEKNENDKYFK